MVAVEVRGMASVTSTKRTTRNGAAAGGESIDADNEGGQTVRPRPQQSRLPVESAAGQGNAEDCHGAIHLATGTVCATMRNRQKTS